MKIHIRLSVCIWLVYIMSNLKKTLLKHVCAWLLIFKRLLIWKTFLRSYVTYAYMGLIKLLVEYFTLFLHILFPRSNSLGCFILKQGATRWPRLALNSWSSDELGLQMCNTMPGSKSISFYLHQAPSFQQHSLSHFPQHHCPPTHLC